MEPTTKKKKPLPDILTYEQFIQRAKIFVRVYRQSKHLPLYTADIPNGWLYKDNFYLRVEGTSWTPNAAIRTLLDKLQDQKLWLDIEEEGKRRYFKVPATIIYDVEELRRNKALDDMPILTPGYLPKRYEGFINKEGHLVSGKSGEA